jgi:hypothetical protein
MTRDELLKGIRNTLANPQSWVDAGLGHNAVQKAEAWCDERARALATWILPMLPVTCEGWENEETWVVWLDLSNRESILERAIQWAKDNAATGRPLQDRVRIAEMLEGTYRDPLRVAAVHLSLRKVALGRVDWLSLADEIVVKAREAGQ